MPARTTISIRVDSATNDALRKIALANGLVIKRGPLKGAGDVGALLRLIKDAYDADAPGVLAALAALARGEG
jgi:hypothetical protein